MHVLTSTRSPHVARLRRLHDRRGRQQSGTFLAEGPDCVAAALAAGWVREVVAEPDHPVAEVASASGLAVHTAKARVIAAICDAVTPQGIVAECVIPERSVTDIVSSSGPIVICDRLADPGNLGTILRTAEAVGASGVMTTPGSVDPWNPKVVRASAGSIFRIPVVIAESIAHAVDAVHTTARKVIALTSDAPTSVFGILDQERRAGRSAHDLAWLVGSEAHGVGAKGLEAADLHASIPMAAPVESLNAAISVAIGLYLAVGADVVGDGSHGRT